MLSASLLVIFISLIAQLLNRPFMGPAEYKKVREVWGERTAAVVSQFSPLGAQQNKGSASTRFRTQQTPPKTQSMYDTPSGRLRSSSGLKVRIAQLRSRGGLAGKKILAWLVNYNTVESVLLFCSVIVMLGGIMFSSDRFANNKNQNELETITWTTLFVIVTSLVYYVAVFTLEVFAQTCPGTCRKRCCDLEQHLGDGYVSRNKARREARRSMFVELGIPGTVSKLGFTRKRSPNGRPVGVNVVGSGGGGGGGGRGHSGPAEKVVELRAMRKDNSGSPTAVAVQLGPKGAAAPASTAGTKRDERREGRNWKQYTDKATGKPYWHSRAFVDGETGESSPARTTWTDPAELKEGADAAGRLQANPMHGNKKHGNRRRRSTIGDRDVLEMSEI